LWTEGREIFRTARFALQPAEGQESAGKRADEVANLDSHKQTLFLGSESATPRRIAKRHFRDLSINSRVFAGTPRDVGHYVALFLASPPSSPP